jgi:anti-anti-sigma regulatory factor
MSAESLQDCRVDLLVCGTEALLSISGEFDVATFELLAEPLQSAVDAGLSVTADLAKVPFIDVGCVRMMIAADEALRRRGRGLRALDASPFLRRVFFVLGAGHLLRG